ARPLSYFASTTQISHARGISRRRQKSGARNAQRPRLSRGTRLGSAGYDMAQPQGAKHRGVFERPRGSGNWWVRYADEHGHIHREKAGPKSLAIRLYTSR